MGASESGSEDLYVRGRYVGGVGFGGSRMYDRIFRRALVTLGRYGVAFLCMSIHVSRRLRCWNTPDRFHKARSHSSRVSRTGYE